MRKTWMLLAALAALPALAQVRKPVGAEDEKPAEKPRPPEPKPEPKQEEAKAPAKKVDPPERAYKKRKGDYVAVVHVRPGDPLPGRDVEVLIDLARAADIPDPVYGDRVPVKGAALVASWNREGEDPVRYAVRAMGEAGSYGVHLWAQKAGAYTLRLEGKAGDDPVAVDFALGVGQPAAEVESEADVGQRSGPRGTRTVLRSGEDAPRLKRYQDPRGVAAMMRELTRRWLDLDASLGDAQPLKAKGPAKRGAKQEWLPSDVGRAQLAAKALSTPAAAVVQTTPDGLGAAADTYNSYARDFVRGVLDLSGKVRGGDLGAAQAALRAMEQAQCVRCHAQFSWRVASDVHGWPKIVEQRVEVKP